MISSVAITARPNLSRMLQRVLVVALTTVPAGVSLVGQTHATPGEASLTQFLGRGPTACKANDGNDDTACIRRWIAHGQATGETLFAPPGTFIYSAQMDVYSGMHLRCAGSGATVFQSETGYDGAFLFTEGEPIEDVVIEDCGFDFNGNTADFGTVIGIKGAPTQNVRIRGNKIFDGMMPPKFEFRRDAILVKGCENCWIENNHLLGGARIVAGKPIVIERPGKLIVTNNILEQPHDNAISVVIFQDQLQSQITVSENTIVDAGDSGIFVGSDGERNTDPALTTLEVEITGNIVVGDWRKCISATLPAIAERVMVTHNICRHTDAGRPTDFGIGILRVNDGHPPSQDTLVAFNTIVGDFSSSGSRFDVGGLLIKGDHRGLRVLGNEIRDVGSTGMRWFAGTQSDAVIGNNILIGTSLVMQGGFDGLIHNNLLLDSAAPALRIIQDPSSRPFRAKIQGNVLRNATASCILIQPTGPKPLLDLAENHFLECGNGGAIAVDGNPDFLQAIRAIRLHNRGDDEPNVTPRTHLSEVQEWRASNVRPGESVGVKVIVPGAEPGDTAIAAFDGFSGAWQVTAYIREPDVVQVWATNHNSTPVSLFGMLRVSVLQF